VLKVDLALYQVGFLIFVLGVLIGGAIAWSSAARRRRHRARREDAELWQARTEWSEKRRAGPAASGASAFLPRPERG